MAKIDPYAKQSAASFGPESLASGNNRDANEDSKDDVVIVEDTCTTTVTASPANYVCSFDDSGLPNHLCGSWNNAKQILELHGVGWFPGSDSRMAVISLTSGICHTVSCSGVSKKPLSCDDQCPALKSQRICSHTIAAACFNGCLESYLCSYTPRLSTLVSSSIPIHTGRKDNEKRQRKRKGTYLAAVLNTFLKTLEPNRRPMTWRKYSSGALQPANVMVAMERYV